ncbi:MAG: universal stress protein [Nitrospirae bacterium]|nr:universal stress protein [Nitrospirota bacterium]
MNLWFASKLKTPTGAIRRKLVAPVAVQALSHNISETGYRCIVCPVTDSDLSRKGIETAAYLSKISGARLILLHVVEQWHKASFMATDSKKWSSLHNEWLEDGRKLLEIIEDKLREEGFNNVEYVLRDGDAEEEIIEITKEKKPDLLVMATDYCSNLEKIFMGDIVERITKKIPCQVLCISK